MANRVDRILSVHGVVVMLGLTLGMGIGSAQSKGNAKEASPQDTQFLQDLAQDSNFEIKTSQLALQKSKSADVKQYANMVVHDHTLLKQKMMSADRAAKHAAAPPSSMSSDNQATYDSLKGLTGDAFDQAYIKELVKGNEHIQQEEKSEASDSTLPAVKNLATQSASLDTKHAEKAKQLASAHNVQK